MKRRARVLLLLLALGPSGAPASFGQTPAPDARMAKLAVDGHTVRGHCGVCHSYELVEAPQLDRANWDWVVDDMIGRFGATWIGPELREAIVDYLVEHHGPAR